MPMFRTKPVVIEARQLDGSFETACSIVKWMNEGLPQIANVIGRLNMGEGTITIRTREGEMISGKTDWIILGVMGEFYPCRPDIFTASYEPIQEPQ